MRSLRCAMEEQESTAHLGSLAARLAELDARASDLRTLERSCNASCETLEEQRTQCHGLAEAAAQQIAKTERVRNLLQAQAQTCDGPILQRQVSLDFTARKCYLRPCSCCELVAEPITQTTEVRHSRMPHVELEPCLRR